MEKIEQNKEVKEGSITNNGVKFYDNQEEKKRMASFQVATPVNGKMEWTNVKAFGNMAEKARDLQPSDNISLEGNQKTEKYTNKEGIEKESKVFIANKIDVVEKSQKISVEGNIGRDGVKIFEGDENKKKMAVFAIAENRDNKTEWHNIKVFDKAVDGVKDLKAGDNVSLEGRLKTEKYVNKEGLPKEVNVIIASQVNLLNKKIDQKAEQKIEQNNKPEIKETKKKSIKI